jgi:hypothetical protein
MKSLLLVALLALISFAIAKKGIIELDEITFPKIVDGSKNVLVSFNEQSWHDPEVLEREYLFEI